MLRRYHWWSLLLNLNVIHTCSNWLCWKAQEKLQVDFRFCKTIGCSYVTLFTTCLAKKQCSNLATGTLGKDVYWFQKQHLKHQNDVTWLLAIWRAIKSFPSVLLSSSTTRNFNNNKPIYVILWEIIAEIFDSWKFKMSTFFYF